MNLVNKTSADYVSIRVLLKKKKKSMSLSLPVPRRIQVMLFVESGYRKCFSS